MSATAPALTVLAAQPPWGLAFGLLALAALLVVLGLVALLRGRRPAVPPTPRETP
ncbi:hypothetical protein H5V45_11660 [Nocardioides sp. KIGAM211]|uniref:Uncharacterized protein n=1 Tax=Nocardioides luti TaxID=2761101 RepID=A0A7X0VC86_9ACTN|nr:hypothetical protein [Nocardioides luti]MBB6627973.1 hypothetical protein [Nocardioides luti]